MNFEFNLTPKLLRLSVTIVDRQSIFFLHCQVTVVDRQIAKQTGKSDNTRNVTERISLRRCPVVIWIISGSVLDSCGGHHFSFVQGGVGILVSVRLGYGRPTVSLLGDPNCQQANDRFMPD